MKNKTEIIIDPSDEIFAIQQEALEEVKNLLPSSEVEAVGAMVIPMKGRPELDLLVISNQIEEDSKILTENKYLQGPVVNNTSFLKKMINDIEVAVQIMSPDNSMVNVHRRIIEILQSDEGLRKRYEEFKTTLSGLSREDYKEKKSGWIRENLKPLF